MDRFRVQGHEESKGVSLDYVRSLVCARAPGPYFPRMMAGLP